MSKNTEIHSEEKEKISLEKTCFNRFCGKCKGCNIDYNSEHHPNNQDCRDYYPMHIGQFTVVEKNHVMD